MQRMLIIRSLRLDRVVFAAQRFVSNNIGAVFTEPPPFDLHDVFKTSRSKTPLVFVLSPGVDPTQNVTSLATKLGGINVGTVSLGQGQAPIALKLIETALNDGTWVFLANCHLMLSWLPDLEKHILGIRNNPNTNPDFRLWLSSNPTSKFPIAILQMGIKMTTEPPRGLKANLMRLYLLMNDAKLERCTQGHKFKKLLFSLCWFHSVLLERRKFKTLGFNIPYDFNDSDYSICEDILCLYLDDYPDTIPFEALRYLTSEANYGGRVTDSWDRRLVNIYIAEFYSMPVVETAKHKLSELPDYYIIPDGKLDDYKNYIKDLPTVDKPAAFGQHPNADVSSQIDDTNILLNTIVSLSGSSNSSGGGGASSEALVLKIAKELTEKAPKPWKLSKVFQLIQDRSDPKPLKTVLKQELDRYNMLLTFIEASLNDLVRGIQGLTVITSEIEQIFNSFLAAKVPVLWSFCYPSLKNLGSWNRDLILRWKQMDSWAREDIPTVFWLSGFTYPTGFLTCLLQVTARNNGIPIDSLNWEFPVFNSQDESSISEAPKEGAFVKGIFLEGAKWDREDACLADADAMELFSAMPIIHFKPVENKKRSKGMYVCPLYLYPVRTGTRERPSFMIGIEVRTGGKDANFWAKRGTAMLLSLAV